MHQMDEYKATLQMVCSRLSDGAYQEILDEIKRPFIEIKILTSVDVSRDEYKAEKCPISRKIGHFLNLSSF